MIKLLSLERIHWGQTSELILRVSGFGKFNPPMQLPQIESFPDTGDAFCLSLSRGVDR
jgi:hypothetical protein